MILYLCDTHTVTDFVEEFAAQGGTRPFTESSTRAKVDGHRCSIGTCGAQATHATRLNFQ